MSTTTSKATKRVLAGLIAAASLAMGVTVTANAAEPTNVALTAKESIVLTATCSGAFTGKTDSIKAIELGKYIAAQSTDGGKHVSAIGVETTEAYKAAITDALKAAGVKDADVNANNPLDDLLELAGDNGKEKPAYSSAIRKAATSLGANATIKAAAGVKGVASNSAEGKTDDVFTFSNLEAGYYLVVDSTSSAGSTAAIPMLVGTKAGGLSFADNPLGTVV